jgi:midasin
MDEVEPMNEQAECEASESFYVCHKENLLSYTRTREEVEASLKSFRESCAPADGQEVDVSMASLRLWQDYESLTQQMAKELCEQLRLILEPTVCSKLKGDYKSGKRLNMKRVIEYIATEYRKDKIWLRRIKPNKRDYQVMLAIDNSSSMGDNHCIQLAYETIATLMNAFNYLEVGQLGLLKFGERVSQLHDLQTNFHTDDGARIIAQIDFRDETTKVAEMLAVSTEVFRSAGGRANRTGSVSKLLVILSDGRGIFYEGMETVRMAIKRAMQEQIFIVFALLETPGKKASIFDIKMPIFEDGVRFL